MNKTQKEIDEELDSFLVDLTELSRKHKIGIADHPVLFCMEPEDVDLVYHCDDKSRLTY